MQLNVRPFKMQILLKNKRNEFTSVLKLFPIQMCFEMFRKEKNQKVGPLKVWKVIEK